MSITGGGELVCFDIAYVDQPVHVGYEVILIAYMYGVM